MLLCKTFGHSQISYRSFVRNDDSQLKRCSALCGYTLGSLFYPGDRAKRVVTLKRRLGPPTHRCGSSFLFYHLQGRLGASVECKEYKTEKSPGLRGTAS